MKTYEETARDVLEMRDEYDRAKKRRTKTLTASISTLTLVAVIISSVVILTTKRSTEPVPVARGEETTETADISEKNDEPLPPTNLITDSGNAVPVYKAYEPNEDGSHNSEEDRIGRIVIDGIEYIQVSAGGIDGEVNDIFMLGEYLGRAEEFDGIYKDLYEEDGITGDVYRINWDDADIVVLLSNGGFVTLRAEK